MASKNKLSNRLKRQYQQDDEQIGKVVDKGREEENKNPFTERTGSYLEETTLQRESSLQQEVNPHQKVGALPEDSPPGLQQPQKEYPSKNRRRLVAPHETGVRNYVQKNERDKTKNQGSNLIQTLGKIVGKSIPYSSAEIQTPSLYDMDAAPSLSPERQQLERQQEDISRLKLPVNEHANIIAMDMAEIEERKKVSRIDSRKHKKSIKG